MNRKSQSEWLKVKDDGGEHTHMGSSVRLLRSLVQSVGGGVSYSSGEVKDRKVVVDSDLPGIVYVRIVEEVARKGGRGRVVGKERRDGGMLSGKGSGPTVVARRQSTMQM